MPIIDSAEAAALASELENPAVEIVARLFKNPIPDIDDDLELADFVEADFPGYAPIRLTEFEYDVFDDMDDYAEAINTQCQWETGAIVTPQTIYGGYITAKGSDNVVRVQTHYLLEAPVTLYAPQQKFDWSVVVMGLANEEA